MKRALLTLTATMLAAPPWALAVPAFPGSEGFGSQTRGAYAGSASPTVYKVTNTNNSGPGSFRAAIEASGSRIIVFQTGGIITITSDLRITNPYLTIAGQTAPGDGIVIRGGSIKVYATASTRPRDIIVRGLRVRPTGLSGIGVSPTNERDCFGTSGNYSNPATNVPYNIVYDRNSCSWSTDEMSTTWVAAENVTFSNNLYYTPSDQLDHHYGLLVGPSSRYITLHHNVLMHSSYRNPLVGGGDGSSRPGATMVESINNVVYNGRRWAGLEVAPQGGTSQYLAYIGEYHKAGVDTDITTSTRDLYTWGFQQATSSSRIYLMGNLTPRRYNHSLAQTAVSNSSTDNPSAMYNSPPFTLSGVTVSEAAANFLFLQGMDGTVPRVGAYPRDIVDTVAIEELSSGSDFYGTAGSWGSGPTTAATTSNWRNNRSHFPYYDPGTLWADADDDGMDDAWEIANFGSIAHCDPHTVAANGYSNIENWINSFFITGGSSTTYRLEITPTNTGSGNGVIFSSPAGINCGPPPTCAAPFAENTVVTLMQESSEGAVFVEWTGACAGQADTCTLTMDGDKSASAVFNLAGVSTTPRPPVGLRIVPGP